MNRQEQWRVKGLIAEFKWAKIVKPTLFFLPVALFISFAEAAQPSKLEPQQDLESQTTQRLDSEFQELLNRFYSRNMNNTARAKSADSLITAVQSSSGQVKGLALIRDSLDVVIKKADLEQFSTLLGYLYDANDTASIKSITQAVNQSGDLAKISQNYLLLAKYYYARNNWRGVQASLSKVEQKKLSIADAHYYYLLKGYSFQAIKKHRKSVEYYKKIPSKSPYYAHAKLNQGTAYLRQGWWTEAYIEFEEAIRALNNESLVLDGKQELANRILVVLGYSQLHYEFYRDARSTLRKVALDSIYTNKALMGLGLAAAHQNDFNGALNVFELLSQKQPKDNNVDESYLLIPFGYEEMKDFAGASVQYQKAIAYFQMRLADLQSERKALTAASPDDLADVIEHLNRRSQELYGGGTLVASYFMANYKILVDMQISAVDVKTKKEVQNLQREYESHLKAITTETIDSRRAMLNSYLSQAKFGVAKLYDKP